MFSTMTTTKFQRTLSRLLLPIFAFWIILNPVRSYAALPAAAGVYAVSPSAIGAASNVIAGPWAGSAASAAGLTGAGAVALGVAAGSLAVGITLGYLIVDNLTGGYSRIPLTVANPVPVPTGAPVAVIPAHAQYRWFDYQAGQYKWGDTFCDTSLSQINSTVLNTPWGFPRNYTSSNCNEANKTASYNFPQATQPSNGQIWAATTLTHTAADFATQTAPASCPTGATISGTAPNQTCVVNNPRTVYPDHSKDYSRSGTTLAPAAGEVDSGASITALPSGGLLVQDLTASGEARHYKIIPQTDGGSSLEIYEPVTNAVGDTGTKKVVIAVSPSGTITGKTQTTTGEQLGQDAAGQPVLNPAPVGTTFTPSSPSGSSITFPNDYARSGEASSASDKVVNAIGTFTTPTGIDPIAPMDSRIQAMSGVPATPTINWMPSLLPGTATVCHAMPIDGGVHGGLLNLSGSASFDICDKLDIVRQILGYFFMIATVVFVFRRFTRSNGETA